MTDFFGTPGPWADVPWLLAAVFLAVFVGAVFRWISGGD